MRQDEPRRRSKLESHSARLRCELGEWHDCLRPGSPDCARAVPRAEGDRGCATDQVHRPGGDILGTDRHLSTTWVRSSSACPSLAWVQVQVSSSPQATGSTHTGYFSLRATECTFSVVWYSDDGGATFKLAKNASDPRKPAMLQLQVEPCLAETPSGGVLVSMRNEAYHRGYNTSNVTCNCRGVARSEDGGSTFGNPRPEPSLVGPVCEASMLSLPTAAGGRVIFHANPGHGTDRESKSPPDGRASGTVRRSFDGGRSWHGAVDINGDQAFSYSCMTELPQQDLVGLAYETVLPGSDTNWRASANNVVFTLVPKRLNGTAPLES